MDLRVEEPVDEVEQPSPLVVAKSGVDGELVDEPGGRQQSLLVREHQIEHRRAPVGREGGECRGVHVGVEHDPLGQTFVPGGGDDEVLEDGRIAGGIAQDLQHGVASELAQALLGSESHRLIGVAAEVHVQPCEDRARQREGAARGGRSNGKGSAAGEDPVDDGGRWGAGRRSGGVAHVAILEAAAGASLARRDLNREARGP